MEKAKYLTLGNTQFDTSALKGKTKTWFMKTYKGSLSGIDINEAWDVIEQYTKKSKSK